MKDTRENQLRVLVLTDQYPNLLQPQLAPFNLQQLTALSTDCPLAIVAPVAWPKVLKAGRVSLPDQVQPYPVEWPVFWYLPRLCRRYHGKAFFYSAWPAIRRRAKELQPNVLLASWLFPAGWAGLLAAHRLGLPLVIKLHGSDLLVLKNDPTRLPYLRKALAGANNVVAVSQHLAEEAMAQGARRVTLVPNGLNQAIFTPAGRSQARAELGLPGRAKLLIFVGRFTHVKGPDLALQALARLEGVNLIMVGGGPLERKLKLLAQKLNVADRVIWAGTQKHEMVPRYMAAADALVLPSRSEGDPNVIIEALGCGRPVVAAEVGGAAVMVGNQNGALCRPDDAMALAENIRRVLEREWQPEKLAEMVANRTWSTSAAALYKVLAEAVENYTA